MSGLGATQNKLAELTHKEFGGRSWIDTLDPVQKAVNKYMPHETAYQEQQKLNQQAAELEAQQNADAAAASLGPQAMAVRPQAAGESLSAGGVAGQSLYGRRRGAARRRLA